jgi:uncharacterized protein (TIGR03435 family)
MFVIDVRMDEPSSGPAARMQMMLRLLEDRFHLRVRRESRETAAYNLVLARGDRRFGPDLHELTAGCRPVIDHDGRQIPGAMRNGPGTLTGHGVAMTGRSPRCRSSSACGSKPREAQSTSSWSKASIGRLTTERGPR